MTDDLHRRPRPRRARRLAVLAVTLGAAGLWTGVAGATDADDSADAGATVTVELPGWDGAVVDGDAADLLARITDAMEQSTNVDDNGSRWTGIDENGSRWTGTGEWGNRWGNRWDGRRW